MDTLKVRDAQEVEDAVRAAIANEQPLEIIGHGTKRRVGQPMATNALLDLSALNAVTAYEPNELIITVQAGAPVADVLSLIDSKNQQFAFEPMHTALLLGTAETEGTIGGMIAAGLAGPRRIKSGGARDHLLGAHAVSGFGESFKAGGKVVKNVTGYDLCKLLAGSWGTLAVMTEVTLKVTPRPESERTLLLRGLDDVAANKAMTQALGSPYDVSGAAHLPGSALRTTGGALADIAQPDQALTLLRLEGITSSASQRAESLRAALNSFGAAELVADATSAALWRAVRDVEPFAASGPRALWPVWRIVCPPASGGAFGQALQRESGGEVIYDWGGGLIWAALPPAADAHAKALRQRVDKIGGHASLIRGADEIRAGIDVFQPQASGLAALGQRVKHSFDPRNVLNRGRLSRGPAA
ncbi:MAG: FAD-binding protein [Rhodopseudomonas palustris]|uniref:FAD-binding protein n=1 Tax=Rhodopseudomonas palustris TaxID=1076 RepID=A0A933RZV0_RHOPL|nr:FAD-binding protein [Rhodopseudomonas palustris]